MSPVPILACPTSSPPPMPHSISCIKHTEQEASSLHLLTTVSYSQRVRVPAWKLQNMQITFSIHLSSKPGVGNLSPMGHKRPTESFNWPPN